MSNYSKKYTSIKNDNHHLFLTWESGYKNLKVYHEGEVIHTEVSPSNFMKGVTFEHPLLQSVQLKFSSGSPIIMQLKVNGVKYLPENNIKKMKESTLGGLAHLFTILAFLSVVGAFLIQLTFGFNLSVPAALIQLVFDIVVIGIYVTSAVLLYKNKPWAYFLGSITFVCMTLLTVFVVALSGFGFANLFNMVIRVAIIVYIVRHFNDVMALMRTKETENPDLLDNSSSIDFEV